MNDEEAMTMSTRTPLLNAILNEANTCTFFFTFKVVYRFFFFWGEGTNWILYGCIQGLPIFSAFNLGTSMMSFDALSYKMPHS
jgi:hypothetical protein